jgi:hypothetical protein
MVLLVLGAWFIVLSVFARAFARLLPVNPVREGWSRRTPLPAGGRGGAVMGERGRVDLERMREVYQRERAALTRGAAAERTRVVRAQASIDRDCHMVGRVGRFRLASDEPAERGGSGAAPTPLQYLLFGVAT